MSHRTYRHVDTPVPYLGLTWRQWLLIVGCAALALAVIDLLHPPTPIALWLGTVLLTGPVAVSYFTSGASVSFGRMLRPRQWLSRRASFRLARRRSVRAGLHGRRATLGDSHRGPLGRRARTWPSSRGLLPLEALSADGVGVLRSGALVRWIEVSPVNPLIHDSEEAEGISRAFTSIAARLPDERQSLELIAQAMPLPVEAILAAEREDCRSAADYARSRCSEQLAVAVERLGLAQEQSIRVQSRALAALELRYFVVAPWQPARERTACGAHGAEQDRSPSRLRSTSAPHARAPATPRESAPTSSRSGSRLTS